MATERSTSPTQQSTAELVNAATAQISRLVHDEFALAKAEMQAKAKRMGVAAGLMASAALLAGIGLVLAWVLLVVALANVWPLWLAVAVPMTGALVLAGAAAWLGKRRLATATPPVPTEASESVRTDLRVVQEAVHEGRRS